MILFFPAVSFAQVGGKHSFEFLNVPNNGRLAGLGGVNVSLADKDINFFFSNPALVSDTLSGWASAGYQFYLADIGQSAFSYAHDFEKIGTVSFGIQHIGYGTISGYDAAGQETGDFKSGETAVVVSKSHQVGNFRFGANLKGVFSSIAGYRSSAVMIDLGCIFIHPDKAFTAGLVIKNAGFVLSRYTPENNATLPFDVQAGTTFKPEHMPLRFSITAYNLARPDIAYYNPDDGNNEPGVIDKVLRHFNLGAEILLHRNFAILVGYNYLIHKELKLEQSGGGAGVSIGINGRIKSFEFTASRNSYVIGTAGYTFTVSTNVRNILIRQ